MPMVEQWGKSDVGRVRRNNEDALAIDTNLNVAIVADGMGGAACGEVASSMTIQTVLAYLQAPEEGQSEKERLTRAIRSANDRVWRASRERVECCGMGTTIVVAHWRDEKVWIANVGDSRAYVWRNGSLLQLSYDQNLANELRINLGLTEEQIRHYPHRNVLTMAIGTAAEVLIRTNEETLQNGDVLLLCSDGLYGPAGEDGITEVLSGDSGLAEMAERLIAHANQRGGPDNITVVLLRYRD